MAVTIEIRETSGDPDVDHVEGWVKSSEFGDVSAGADVTSTTVTVRPGFAFVVLEPGTPDEDSADVDVWETTGDPDTEHVRLILPKTVLGVQGEAGDTVEALPVPTDRGVALIVPLEVAPTP